MIPFKYNLSYADVLDEIIRAMKKKNDSNCWMIDGWFIQRTGPFLKKGTTLEELLIEFGLS